MDEFTWRGYATYVLVAGGCMFAFYTIEDRSDPWGTLIRSLVFALVSELLTYGLNHLINKWQASRDQKR